MVSYVCKDETGQIVASTEEDGAPLTFLVGMAETISNPLFKGIDQAVKGLSAGDVTTLEASGGEWTEDLFFTVPRDHQEIQRLEGRYKSQGGLQEQQLVELANGQVALVVNIDDQKVQLDANNMLAGKMLTFELSVIDVQKSQAPPDLNA